MFTIRLLEEGSSGIEMVTWVVLAIFFAMVVLGWLVASKGWLKEDQEATRGSHEEHDSHDETIHA